MNLEGSRILVTGGAGLIGSHIVDRLIAEHSKEIIVLVRNRSSISRFMENCSPELDYRNMKVLDGDITQVDQVREVLKGVDIVFHTASLLTRDTNKDLRTAFEVNIAGTFNLIEESIASGVKKFIYSSSNSVYGDALTDPMTEEHPFNTNEMYGAGKVAGELFLRVFKKAKGLAYVALRYTVVYGPRQHYKGNIVQYVPECFDNIDRGVPPMIHRDGSQQYDYVYVEDAARANILALKSPVTEGSFNIATGVRTAVKEVVQMIIEITGTSLEPVYVPQRERFRKIRSPLDVTKAEKMLGFRAEVSLREGLQRYFDWRKKRGLSKG
jgi:UDP-glucose 4-epimerase